MAPLRMVVASLVLASTASADTLPVSLIWQAPEPCPDRSEVWRRLSQRLGRMAVPPSSASLAARAVAERADVGWKLELQTLSVSGVGQRTLTGTTCEDVTNQAVVALALAIDPLLPPLPEFPDWKVWLSVGPTLSFFRLPDRSAALGVRFGARIEAKVLSAELSVGSSPFEHRIDGEPFTFNPPFVISAPLEASLAGCAGWQGEILRLGGCLTVDTGLLAARGIGLTFGFASGTPGDTAAYLEFGGRLEARVRLTAQFALRVIGGAAWVPVPTHGVALPKEWRLWSSNAMVLSGAILIDYRVW